MNIKHDLKMHASTAFTKKEIMRYIALFIFLLKEGI